MTAHQVHEQQLELRTMTEHEICVFLRTTKPEPHDTPSARLMEQRKLAMTELLRRDMIAQSNVLASGR